MSIVSRVEEYLNQQNIHYDLIQHAPSESSLSSAQHAKISPAKLAKAVVLEDHEGRRMMALLPSTHKISFHKLADELNRDFHLLSEKHLYPLFNDCQPGAVPPVSHAYQMDTVYDDLLFEQRDVFLEAGDHLSLIHLKHPEFSKLVQNCRHGRFSGEVFH
jgi:Ala-tRNA(Pro) deacylase